MKFRAVVITKKKIIIAAVSAALTAAIGVCEALSNVTFPADSPVYERMLSSAAGEGQSPPDIKAGLKKAVGFDPSAPETIIDEYMGVSPEDEAGQDSEPEDGGASDNVGEPNEKSGDTDIYEEAGGEPPFPSKEQICAAGDLALNNATDYSVDLAALCAGEIDLYPEGDGPLVLIVHTHTTECYNGDEMPGETERTTDTEKSVVAVGNVIADTLEENGIHVYHDTTFHDYPSYQGSYTRELTTITNIMEQNPSIKIVLDVHRDAFVYNDGTRLRVVDENADAPTSQVMLVSGTDSMGLYNPNWRENLKFAAKIQNAAEIMYPGLMRPIDLRTERFNLHMTKGSLIIEVGSNGNTLEEAKNAGRAVARAIAAVLSQ